MIQEGRGLARQGCGIGGETGRTDDFGLSYVSDGSHSASACSYGSNWRTSWHLAAKRANYKRPEIDQDIGNR